MGFFDNNPEQQPDEKANNTSSNNSSKLRKPRRRLSDKSDCSAEDLKDGSKKKSFNVGRRLSKKAAARRQSFQSTHSTHSNNSFNGRAANQPTKNPSHFEGMLNLCDEAQILEDDDVPNLRSKSPLPRDGLRSQNPLPENLRSKSPLPKAHIRAKSEGLRSKSPLPNDTKTSLQRSLANYETKASSRRRYQVPSEIRPGNPIGKERRHSIQTMIGSFSSSFRSEVDESDEEPERGGVAMRKMSVSTTTTASSYSFDTKSFASVTDKSVRSTASKKKRQSESAVSQSLMRSIDTAFLTSVIGDLKAETTEEQLENEELDPERENTHVLQLLVN